MAVLRYRGPGRPEPVEVPTNLTESLLTSLLKAGRPIRHDCGGKALCGTCRVRVLEGTSALSPVSDREKSRLAAAGAAPGERLACQAHAARDAEIEAVLPLEGPSPGTKGVTG
mgnify:CR=1 FL=1